MDSYTEIRRDETDAIPIDSNETDAIPIDSNEANTESISFDVSISNSDSLSSLSEDPKTEALPIISEDGNNINNAIPKPTDEGNNKISATPKSSKDSSNKTDALPIPFDYPSKNTRATLTPIVAPNCNTQAALLPKENPKKELEPECHNVDPVPKQPDSSYNTQPTDGAKYLSMFSGCKNINIGMSHLVIGNSNLTTIYGSEQLKLKHENPKEKFSRYLNSNAKLTEKHLSKISFFLGSKWKHVGRYLEIKNSELENIETNNQNNVVEQGFQMLNRWLQISKSETCTTGKLSEALFETQCYETIQYLPLDDE